MRLPPRIGSWFPDVEHQRAIDQARERSNLNAQFLAGLVWGMGMLSVLSPSWWRQVRLAASQAVYWADKVRSLELEAAKPREHIVLGLYRRVAAPIETKGDV